MNRMRRAERLLRHYERITDNCAARLSVARQALSNISADIAALQDLQASVNQLLSPKCGELIDLAMARTMDAYKRDLRRAINARRARLPAAIAEIEARRRDVVEAQRSQKAWELLRDRVQSAISTDALRSTLLEADDLMLRARCHGGATGNTVPITRQRR